MKWAFVFMVCSCAAWGDVSLGGGAVGFADREVRQPRYSDVSAKVEKVSAGLDRVEWEFRPQVGQMARQLAVQMRFLPAGTRAQWEAARREFHWIPNIKMKPEQVASDHVFRSPAVMLMSGGTGVALIPDLDTLAKQRPVSQYLDLRFPDGEAPVVEFGFAATEPEGHVYYRLGGRDLNWEYTGPVRLAAFVLVMQKTTRYELLQRVSDFLWSRYGHSRVAKAPQTASFDTVARYGYEMALRDLWVQGPAAGTGGITLTTFLDAGKEYRGREFSHDLWFHSWFNNMRTAYGMYQWGKRLGRAEWVERGREVARLLVSAPRDGGLFPTIYIPEGKRWQKSGQGGGAAVYHLPDNAWSALWLMRFDRDCERVDGAERMLREFAARLVALQRADGSFPARVGDEVLAGSAEGALPVWFLGEMVLAGLVGDEGRAAVRRGLDYLHGHVIEPQRFEDFELTFSCSPKPLGYFDASTHLYAQGTLALQWTAEAFRVGYLIARREQDLLDGRFSLNLMNQYQQVWAPPYLSFYGFGGYGVMNTDGEWNDARQAQFAETNANYFDVTGDVNLLERAVAAARASFTLVVMDENKAVAPRNYRGTTVNHEVHGASAENYGHSGWDKRSYQSGFHWGTGSGLTTAAILTARYPARF